ncbi:MAG: tetratricopeptide repeat protein [Thermoflexales bacterium]
MGHRAEKDYPAAIAIHQEYLAQRRARDPESEDVAIALNDLTDVERLQRDLSAAERDYREALRMSKKAGSRELVAGLTGSLAELALDREEWAAAEALSREALGLAEGLGRQQLVGAHCQRLAAALARQGRPQEGLPCAQRAVEIYTLLLIPDDLATTQAALKECGG